jgi:hypothetical protein
MVFEGCGEKSKPMRDEKLIGWRKVHNEKLHNLCSSPNIIRTIQSRRVRWVGM